METWLAPFAALFTQPSWLNALALATGALLCLNRRTVCAALRAVDGASDQGFSRFHRFLSRGAWSGLQGSRILLGLLVRAFVPDGQPLVIGVDDSIERRRGGMIRDKGIYRDPVRSSRGFFVKVEGLRWLSFHLLGKPGFAKRTWGLPFLTLLCPSERADAKRQRPHRTVPEKAMSGMRLIARWLPHRRNGVVELARDHPAGAMGLDQGSGRTRRDARLRLFRPGANGSGDPDVVCDALGGGSHLRGNPPPSRHRDPAPMGGSGDPAHHAAAARVVLAGDAVGRRPGGADRQAPGPGRGLVQEPGPDLRRLPRRRPADTLGRRGGAPDPVAG